MGEMEIIAPLQAYAAERTLVIIEKIIFPLHA
jgi:hypothetical protein